MFFLKNHVDSYYFIMFPKKILWNSWQLLALLFYSKESGFRKSNFYWVKQNRVGLELTKIASIYSTQF